MVTKLNCVFVWHGMLEGNDVGRMLMMMHCGISHHFPCLSCDENNIGRVGAAT